MIRQSPEYRMTDNYGGPVEHQVGHQEEHFLEGENDEYEDNNQAYFDPAEINRVRNQNFSMGKPPRGASQLGRISKDSVGEEDKDTVDLIGSKVCQLSQSSDREHFRPPAQDEFLNIMESNLENISVQLRQSSTSGQNPREAKQNSRVQNSAANQKKLEDSQERDSGSLRRHFDFNILRMYHATFEEEFEANYHMDNRALVYLFSLLDSSATKSRVGALTQIYKAIYTFQLERPEDLQTVVNTLCDLVLEGKHRECPYTLYVALEMIYFIGCNQENKPDLIALLSSLVHLYECEDVQRKAIRLLFSLGSEGLQEIIQLCQAETEVSRLTILLLINEPTVIETVIVPALLNHFHSSDTRVQIKAVVALGKLGNLSGRSDAVPLFADLLMSSPLDHTIIVGALRATGVEGERELNRLFKKIKNPKIRSSILYFLGQYLPDEFADHLEIAAFE